MNLSTLQLDELQKLGSGSECVVYDLGDGTCYKKYKSHIDVEPIYYNAKIAHEFGIAPEVYECDEHGYRTEIVETIGGEFSEENDNAHAIKDSAKRNELQIKAEELFGKDAAYDLHVYNIGIKNGKLIMIDFGEASRLSGA